MRVSYDARNPQISFGAAELLQQLKAAGHPVVPQHEHLSPRQARESGVVVRLRPFDPVEKFLSASDGNDIGGSVDESFSISRDGAATYVEANDPRGLMYGCLELAERVARGQWETMTLPIEQTPALGLRGTKFNLPYSPYAHGEPFSANEETCMDMAFWSGYLDMLAKSRYNCLSLWSEHPFHLLVSSPRFRAANPLSDDEIARNQEFFHQLFQYACDRGIDVYLFTWNICIPTDVAKGLGLPAAIGEYEGESRYEYMRVRQQQEIVRDYVEEMVYQTLLGYPELAGLGTSASEAMAGTGYEKEQWIVDTYLHAIERSGRTVNFIHRTNMQSAGGEIKALVQPVVPSERFFISWKYSNAHCYSSPRPQFENLWNAWDSIDLDTTNILFTVRNDDVHTHRWGDHEYVREYIRGIVAKPYAKGFYWGADGYTWGLDFQHVGHGHKTWSYDYERQRYQFQLWGRLAYDPSIDDAVWEHLLAETFGSTHASLFQRGLTHASRIIPAVNRLFWINYDYQWHPESCLSRHDGFKTVLDFAAGEPMPGVGVMGIAEWVRREAEAATQDAGSSPQTETFSEDPADIIRTLRESADIADDSATRLDAELGDDNGGQPECTVFDLRSMAALGRYYAEKFSAAVELQRYAQLGDATAKARAVAGLELALEHWKVVGFYWGRHYRPYDMARVGRTFGYPYYLHDVAQDIERARGYEPNEPNQKTIREASGS